MMLGELERLFFNLHVSSKTRCSALFLADSYPFKLGVPQYKESLKRFNASIIVRVKAFVKR